MAEIGPDTGEKQVASALAIPDSPGAVISRSKFLTGATVGLGALLGVALAVPLVAFSFGPALGGEEWYWSNLGPIDQYPVQDPADPNAWKYAEVTYQRAPAVGELQHRVVNIVRLAEEPKADGDMALISNVCMHLGCPVRGLIGSFACPCHGGQYDGEGRVTAGPPVRPLNRLEWKIENGNLYAGRTFATKEVGGRVVRSDVWKDAGQPVDGLLSYLYPAPPR